MPDPFARPLSAIECEMRQLLTLNRDAHQQLASVRAEQADLAAHEVHLLAAIEGRRAKFDRLLDERNRATLNA